MDVDWSPIEKICRTHSIALERNDIYDRPPLDEVGPIEHKDNCWLGKNYVDQPDKHKLGCDQRCIKDAVAKLRGRG